MPFTHSVRHAAVWNCKPLSLSIKGILFFFSSKVVRLMNPEDAGYYAICVISHKQYAYPMTEKSAQNYLVIFAILKASERVSFLLQQ